jgi:prepilin peptidase CpaA
VIFLLCLSVLAGLLIVGAIIDIESRKLPNWLTASVAALYGLHVIASPTPIDWPLAFLVGSIAFALGFVCFAFNLMGGGDVKLIAALALWAGFDHITLFLLVTALTGGLLSIIALIGQRLATSPFLVMSGPLHHLAMKILPTPMGNENPLENAVPSSGDHQFTLPYGVAIAVGGFAVILALLQS